MSLQTRICITAACDECGTDWVSENFAPHFSGPQDAIDALELHGWHVEELADGEHSLTCPNCPGPQDKTGQKPDCDTHGHHWFGSGALQLCVVCFTSRETSDHDHDWRYEPMQVLPWGGPDKTGDTWGPWRICKACEKAEFLVVEPPPDYPEWLSLELDDASEEYLAWLDAELWPEDADPQHTRDGQARLDAAKEI